MRVYAAGVFVAVVLVGHGVAFAQNLPPVARLSVSPLEPLVGEPVSLDASASVDLDEGPDALTFLWDLDDGTTATGPIVVHAFDAARAHRVRVAVSDGSTSTEASATVFVLAPVASPSASSGPIATTDGLVLIADSIGRRVVALDAVSVEPRWSVDVDDPRSLAVSADGRAVLVACGDGALRELAVDTGAVRGEIPLGASLDALAVVPADGRVLVTDSDRGEVHVLGSELSRQATIAVGGDPRSLAIDADGRRAYVASFLTRSPATAGVVMVVDPLRGEVVSRFELALDTSPDTASSGGGVPNLLGAIAIEPSGARLWVGGTKSNTGRGMRLDGRELTPENRVRGLAAPIALPEGGDRADARIDTNDAGQVSAMAFSPRGRYVYLAHPGIGAVSVYDLASAALFEGREPGSTVPVAARIEVGDTPDGLALAPDGSRLYVRLRERLEVVAIDVRDPLAPLIAGRASLGSDPRTPEVALGARMFHSSRPPLRSRGGYIACATCHPGGAMDGRTWDFTQFGEGLRNTIDLRGRAGLGDGPLHWSANFDEVQDFENDIVFGFGGEGLAQDGEGPHAPLGERANAGRSAELDGLAAYVTSLDAVPPSPHRTPEGTWTQAGERGRRLFFDDEVGCAGCHAPPRFTDSRIGGERHDVGTLRESSGGRLGGVLDGLDTPSLRGCWATAPYLHDGRAPDLAAVVAASAIDDRHGHTSHLTVAERADLVAFLEQLDGRAVESPSSGGCAATPGGPTPWPCWILVLAMVLRRANWRVAPPRRPLFAVWL